MWSKIKSRAKNFYGRGRAVAGIGKYWVRGTFPPAVIYQMGSVGSTALRNSLRKSYPGFVLRTHVFGGDTGSPVVNTICRFCISGGAKLKIISMVRDPISYNVSRFFANAPHHTDVPLQDWPENVDELNDVDGLIQQFLDRFSHERVLHWFDSWGEKIGVDVYRHSFPEEGNLVIGNENTEVLIYRLEIPDEAKETAVETFLGLDDIKIERTNQGMEKPYAKKYSEFKNEFTPPEWYIEKMYNNRYFDHFYTEDHREQFISKWKE